MEANQDVWITRAEGAKRLGVHSNTALKIFIAGGVRRYAPPGVDALWHSGDIQRVIDEAVKSGPYTPRRRRKAEAVAS